MPKLPETSIATAATAVEFIERTAAWSSTGTITLGRGFERRDYADLFNHRPATATVRNYLLRDVHLDTPCMTLIKDGHKIKETNYLVPPSYYENASIVETNMVHLEQGVNYVMARGFPNYYHWLVQTVPAIDWSLRGLQITCPTLLSGKLNGWQSEFLSILGYQHIPIIALNPTNHYSIPTLFYSEFQNGSTAFEVSTTAQRTFRYLAQLVETESIYTDDIIYVARSDTKNRVAANEDEVVKRLASEGVQIVVPGDLTVAQQIRLFGRVLAVVGPHGAGLTNLVFCRPGTIVYEMLPRHYLNACFNRLAQAAQLNYTADLFASIGTNAADPHKQGWSLDPDIVVERVRAIKDRLVSDRRRPTTVAYNSPAMDYLMGKGDRPVSKSTPKAADAADIGRPTRFGWLRRLFQR